LQEALAVIPKVPGLVNLRGSCSKFFIRVKSCPN